MRTKQTENLKLINTCLLMPNQEILKLQLQIPIIYKFICYHMVFKYKIMKIWEDQKIIQIIKGR